MIAPVTEIEAGDDRAWFDANPERRFRARVADSGGVWLVRRHRNVPFRIFAEAGSSKFSRSALGEMPDNDLEIAQRWFQAAWPDWSIAKIKWASTKALRESAR